MKDAILAYLDVVDRVGGFSHREHEEALEGLRAAVVEKPKPARKPAAKKAVAKKTSSVSKKKGGK